MAKENLTVLDGAFGTFLWEKSGDHDPVWTYNITKPEIVAAVTKEYVAAGSQVVQTNTFSCNRPSVEKEKLDMDVKDIIRAGVRIAKEATAGTDTKVSFSIGPLVEMLDPYGDMEEEECEEIYREVIEAGMEEHPDYIQLETFIDLNMLRIAAEIACEQGVPVLCTMSFGAKGKTIFGNSVEDMIEELEELGVAGVGLNCSLGPDQAIPVIREFAEKTELPLIFKPNAGLPVTNADGSTEQPYTAEMFADEVSQVFDIVSYVGGCCGSSPEYITAICKKAE